MQNSTSSTFRSLVFGVAIAAVWLVLAPLAEAATKPSPPQPVAAPPVSEPTPPPLPTGTLDRIRAQGKLVLGYRTDAKPFSYRDEAGQPAGYSVAVCRKVAEKFQAQLELPALPVEWMVSTGMQALREARLDLVCGADVATQTARTDVSFSIPVFPNGVAGLVRSDASDALQRTLEERPAPYQLLWRGTPPKALDRRTFAVVSGTPTVDWLSGRIATFGLTATMAPVEGYDAGVTRVLDGDADVLVGDRARLLEATKRNAKARDLRVLTRHFTFEPIALPLARNDDDFRLAVDRALTGIYLDPQFGALYTATFGAPDADTVAFFRSVAVPK